MIRLGIVGARGLNYFDGFVDMPDVKVAAFCEADPAKLESLADQYKIDKRYRFFEDMADSDLDAIMVATPMQLHVSQSITALKSGKHVLCEVPANSFLEELFWLKQAVEASDRVFMMCENYNYRPDVVLVNKLIDQGRFGEIYYGESEYIEDIRSWLVYPNGKDSWRKYWQVGKRGSFYPTHCLGPLMSFFRDDQIDTVVSYGSGNYVDPDFRQEDTTTTLLRLKSGKFINIRVDVMSPRPNQNAYFALQGTKGALETGRGPLGQESMDRIYFSDGKVKPSRGILWEDLWSYSDLLPENYRNMPLGAQKLAANGDYNSCGGDYYVVQDFIKTIRGEISNPVDVYKACEWSSVANLSELSIQRGSLPVKMPDWRAKTPELVI